MPSLAAHIVSEPTSELEVVVKFQVASMVMQLWGPTPLLHAEAPAWELGSRMRVNLPSSPREPTEPTRIGIFVFNTEV